MRGLAQNQNNFKNSRILYREDYDGQVLRLQNHHPVLHCVLRLLHHLVF